MLTVLPESNARRERRTKGMTVSVVLHAALIALAIHATGMGAPAPRASPPRDTLVYVAPAPPKAPPPPPLSRATPSSSSAPIASVRTVAVPTIAVPIDVPTGIPAPALTDLRVGSDAFRAVPSSEGAAPTSTSSGAPTGGVHTVYTVDKPALALGGVTPRYPPSLEAAGIEGTVVMQFVVDTTGRADPQSVHVMRSDHALFEQAVRDALTRMRFVPAEVAGRKVRQLVEQAFKFEKRER